MAHIGLGSGFVIFGTVAHKILVLAHTCGRISLREIAAELEQGDARGLSSVSTNLDRLMKHGYLYRVGYETPPFGRGYYLYSLDPNARQKERRQLKSGVERSRKYREKGARKVASVFEWRGNISLGSRV